MDPVTQIAVGSAAAAALSQPRHLRLALLVGGIAGGAPDLDVLIRSDVDPLLFLRYHRHFTHSLFFAPILGVLVGGLFFGIFRRWTDASYRELTKFGVLGALTHGPIDACTSYGTLLYWPLSCHRESWDVISIVDPLFTPVLLFALFLALILRKLGWVYIGLVYCLLYLALGLLQRERAEFVVREIAAAEGHAIEDISVRPSFANIVVWRLIYFDGEHYHINAASLLPFRAPVIVGGQSVDSLDESRLEALVSRGSVQWRDFERFDFFSQGYVYQLPHDPLVIGDLRYAMSPEQVQPLWGIRLNPSEPDSHVSFAYFRNDPQGALSRIWTMIVDPKAL